MSRPVRVGTAWTAVAVFLFVTLGAPASAEPPVSSTSKLKYRSAKAETGVLYEYEKTDLDGTKEAKLLVYIPSRSRMELLEVPAGGSEPRIFSVEMDWGTFSAGQVDQLVEPKGGPSARVVSASLGAESVDFRVEDPKRAYPSGAGPASLSVPVAQLPVHLAGLDLITLGFSIRFLTDPEAGFDVGVLRSGDASSPASWAGKASVSYVEDVDRDGVTCRKYRVAAPFIDGGEGFIWLSKEKGYVQDMEIGLSPGPGWKDLKLTLKAVKKISAGEWDERRGEELGGQR